MSQSIHYKIADQEAEFLQIHQLNYRTFVQEIPQHAENPSHSLVDRFHAENTYCIAVDGERLVGMLCLRAVRPFSLDEKLSDLDRYLPAGQRVCEIRLLAVEPEYRHTNVFAGLLRLTLATCLARDWSMAVVSATVLQQKLYANMGFVAFADLVGKPGAWYQPMYLSLASARQIARRLGGLSAIQEQDPQASVPPIAHALGTGFSSMDEVKENGDECLTYSFLPGPVQIAQAVRDTFAKRRSPIAVANFYKA